MNNCKLLTKALMVGGTAAHDMMDVMGVSHTWYEDKHAEDLQGSHGYNGLRAKVWLVQPKRIQGYYRVYVARHGE